MPGAAVPGACTLLLTPQGLSQPSHLITPCVLRQGWGGCPHCCDSASTVTSLPAGTSLALPLPGDKSSPLPEAQVPTPGLETSSTLYLPGQGWDHDAVAVMPSVVPMATAAGPQHDGQHQQHHPQQMLLPRMPSPSLPLGLEQEISAPHHSSTSHRIPAHPSAAGKPLPALLLMAHAGRRCQISATSAQL